MHGIPQFASLFCCLIFTWQYASAEVITIDVVIKAVDSKESSLTVTRNSKKKSKDIELEVAKNVTVMIDGKQAKLDALKPGTKAAITYDDKLEIVKKIEAEGNIEAAITSDNSEDDDDGFKPLIANDSLDGWYFKDDVTKPNWEVKNGELTYKSAGPSLISDKKFKDFEMRLEFKLTKDCNCGVLLRGRYEVKLNDTPNGKATSIRPDSRIGAIYGQIVPTKNTYKGANQWNRLEVKLVDKIVTVKINDETVIDEQEIPGGPSPVALDRHEDLPGPIMLFAHPKGMGAKFRNIKVKALEED